MKKSSLRTTGAALLLSLFSLPALKAQLVEEETVLFLGSDWDYLLYAPEAGGFVPSDPSVADVDFYTTWQEGGVGYDGPEFTTGTAPLGYGVVTGDPLVTNIWETRDGADAPPLGSRYTSYYRTTITPSADTTALRFRGILDDGAVIYVNGVEVARSANMDASQDVWDLFATATGSEIDVQTIDATGLSLTGGVTATIGVSVHNAPNAAGLANSSDTGLNFEIITLSSPPAQPPANDDFENAEVITALLPATVTGRTHNNEGGPIAEHGLGATHQGGELSHAGVTNVGSIWYSYTPANDIRVAITAGQSSYDSVIAVYTGASLGALTEITSSATDEPFYPRATVFVEMTAGTTYMIAVDGEDNGGAPVEDENFGIVSLSIIPAPASPFVPISTVLPQGSSWLILFPTEDDPVVAEDKNRPVDPELAGTGDPDFDATWHTAIGYDGPGFLGPAPAPLGYGIIDADPIVTDIWGARDTDDDPATINLLPPSGERYAVYFRTTFTPATAVTHLGFRGLIDDGATIYINGEEVASMNFDGDPNDWRAFARDANIDGITSELLAQEAVALNVNLPANVTVEIGVVVRNPNATSSDLGFDLEVYSIEQPVIDFGKDFVSDGPFKISFESAIDGATNGNGTNGSQDNLSWVAQAGSAAEFSALPNPPLNGGTAAYVNNGTIRIESGSIDLANVDNSTIVASFDFRTFEDSGGSDFEANDTVEAFIEGSVDGFSFTRVATIQAVINGGTPDDLKPLELPDGAYTNYSSNPGAIPADIRSIRIVVVAVNTSDSEHFFADNICVFTAQPRFLATIDRNRDTGANTISWEDDGSSLYEVRYSPDLKTWTIIAADSGISSFTHIPPAGTIEGFYQVRRFDD